MRTATATLVLCFLGSLGIAACDDETPAVDAGPDTSTDADVPIQQDADSEADSDEEVCVPLCEGRECGTDGCGETCAPGCAEGQACSEAGACVTPERTWVTVSAGTFTMGSPVGEVGRYDAEAPHEVTLTHSFSIQTTEVTQLEFEAVLGYNPAHFVECGWECPVESVSWHQAAAYCNELSDIEDIDECYSCLDIGESFRCELRASYTSPYDCTGYRLPTEAEWEFATRAGVVAATYRGDLSIEQLACESPHEILDPIANFCGNSGGPWDGTTRAVGLGEANAWGLRDTLGNVWEWCHDWHADYSADPVSDPWGPVLGVNRIARGGAWNVDARQLRAAHRSALDPLEASNAIGFRPARTLP